MCVPLVMPLPFAPDRIEETTRVVLKVIESQANLKKQQSRLAATMNWIIQALGFLVMRWLEI